MIKVIAKHIPAITRNICDTELYAVVNSLMPKDKAKVINPISLRYFITAFIVLISVYNAAKLTILF
jgi:hypothetical protein